MQPVTPDPSATHRPAPLPPGWPAWQLRLLGAVELRRDGQAPGRWPSRAAASLLARLALAPDRDHPREELVELLWPGVALDVGRNRLRQTLSTLKSLLEPSASAPPVIGADRQNLRLQPGALVCDALRFEQQVRAGQWSEARDLYRGELMPGFYDDWVLEARAHLATLFDRVDTHTPPPPQAMATPLLAHPLPASWTRVFGIEHSATRLLTLLRHERLVTVVGPGGCGKSRLSLEAARALRDMPAWSLGADAGPAADVHFERIVFVPLADCVDEAQALAALARALNVSGRDPLQQMCTRLAGARSLLVLDNFEQLVAHAQGLVMSLLEGVSTLHLLVTSRQRLGLPGEQVFVLGGLPLPDAEAERQVDAAALSPAVALFVDRARAARADFHLSAAELPAVCALVRLLDGMPLALELAASRVSSFTPTQMRQLLAVGDEGAHLNLLSRSGPRAGYDARHASIAEVIDWSWRLLSPHERVLLATLSTFAGDAGLTGLAAVLQESPAAVAARLDDLAGHSLLRVLTAEGRPPRFALVEPVREFVRAQWPAPHLLQLQRALQAWLLQWASGLRPTPAAADVDAEMRSVLSLLAAPALPAQDALALALALRNHWDSNGMPASLQSALEQALQRHEAEATADDSRLASEAHEMLSYLRFEAGFVAEALSHAERALQRAGADAACRARALVRRAWVELAAGRGDGDADPRTAQLLAWLDEALELARSVDDRAAQARALHQLAVVASHVQQDWVRAESMLAQSQALWLALGDRRKAFARLRNRGQCWLRMGRTDEARACFEQCAQVAEDEGDWVGQIDSLLSLSSLLSARRQWLDALAVDRRCVALCWQRWHRHGLGYALWNPPRALAHLRRPDDALRLMAFAAGYWASSFGPLSRSDRQTVRRVRGLVCAQVGAARTEALWAEGAAMDIGRAVALALQA